MNKQALVAAVMSLIPIALTQSSTEAENHGIVVANIDRSVRPGDDFFRYANGDWIKRTQVPADSGYVAVGGWAREDQSTESSRRRIAAIIEDAIKANAPAGSTTRKIADLYRSYMDEAGIEAKGLAPLQPYLAAIAAIRDKRDLARVLGESLRADVDPLNWSYFHTPNLFGLWVAPDFNDPEHYAPYLLQGGLEMPDREYYLSDEAAMRDIRAKYQTHVRTILKFVGFTNAETRAQKVMELEHAIAEKHVPFEDEQDIHTANNPWKLADFAAEAPGLDWGEYFRGAGLSQQTSFIVWQPKAFIDESALVASAALDTWKDWLAFHFIEAYAAVLPKALSDERFAFFGTALSGSTKQLPRARRAIVLIDNPSDETGAAFIEGRGVLAEAVGRVYAERHFKPEAVSQVRTMVSGIVAALRSHIDALSWMDPATKAEAKSKLDNLYVGIGYPETWRDYSSYEVHKDDIFGNVWRGSLFDYHRVVARLGRAVNRADWCMPPQIVDAVELPLQNAILFPAAILEPPFFDPQAPAAFNYGAAGVFMGHELSHIFDIEGSAVDASRRVRNWWKPADLAHFDAATRALIAQYDAYKPFPDLSVKGKQVLNENIADLGGLAAAYDAYRASLAGKTAPIVNGLSGDQQFFLAWAQSNASKSNPTVLRQQVMTDVHSPDEFRADTVRNLDAWYAAFNVKAGDKLYLAPPERIRIW